jgi:hypothetical protein
VQAFQFAAKASGVNPDIAERMTKGLAQAADENSAAGQSARKELKECPGVDFYDDLDRLKPTEQIIGELADALNRLPEGLQRSAAGIEIFKRIGPDVIPFLKDFRANMLKSDEIGGTFTNKDIEMFDSWKQAIVAMDEEWKRFKAGVLKPLAVTATIAMKAVNEAVQSGGEIPEGGRHSPLEINPIIPALRAMGLTTEAKDRPPMPKAPGVPADLSPENVARQKKLRSRCGKRAEYEALAQF